VDRRRFLQLVTGAGVTTAAAAEVGFVAEFWQWLTKRPKTFVPKKLVISKPAMAIYDPLQIQTHEIAADAMLPELASLSKLATIYYDKKALEVLKSKQDVINHILKNGYGSVRVNWQDVS